MDKYKIGYTTGVFDMFHIGHLNILRRAKEQCDYLIVGVSTDELVLHDKNKIPIIPFRDRCRIVEAIKYVDKVVPQINKDKLAAWYQFHFDIMFVGSDWKGTPQWETFEKQFTPLGVEIVYLSHTDGISSTLLREKITPPLGNKVIGYTQGTFDLFHYGHLNLLQQAKTYCDYLIVGVNSDELVEDYKHKKPVVSDTERSEIVSSIVGVDNSVIIDTLDKIDAFTKFNFNKIFIGDDWKGNDRWRQTELDLKPYGAEVVYLSHSDGISTTFLRERLGERNNSVT